MNKIFANLLIITLATITYSQLLRNINLNDKFYENYNKPINPLLKTMNKTSYMNLSPNSFFLDHLNTDYYLNTKEKLIEDLYPLKSQLKQRQHYLKDLPIKSYIDQSYLVKRVLADYKKRQAILADYKKRSTYYDNDDDHDGNDDNTSINMN
uniref:Secreted protein n=1 Tax=Schistosoma mansoni TaxID=6183 RepID=A0A3Q0KND9_SCHMA